MGPAYFFMFVSAVAAVGIVINYIGYRHDKALAQENKK